MKKYANNLKLKTIVWIICLSLAGVGSSWAKAPSEVSMTTYGVGTAAYIFSASIAVGVQKVSKIKTRVMPAGNDVGRLLPLRAGEVDFSIATGTTGWLVSHGAGDFAAEAWGPQPIRIGWRGGNLFVGYYTRADSGIKDLSQLKGKRVAQIPGSASINRLIQGALAFGGLTLNDCTVVKIGGHGAAGKALTQGAIDCYVFGTTGVRPMETSASPHGIYWFDMDQNNKSAWDRYYKFCPWTTKAMVTRYAGKDKGHKPFHAVTYPYNMWTWKNTSVDTVYAYAKAMWESYDQYKTGHAELVGWNHKNLADTKGCFTPFHEGLVKLLKEKGKWTPAHEAFQKTQLDQEAKRMDLWRQALKDAKAQKVKVGSDKWKKTWWDKLAAANLLR